MAGLAKPKKYDWKDSNLALFGSDLEKKVKKASAETEKAWEKAGQRPGLQIWRIVKFKVTHWPKEDYGKFFNGDSYIILRTYKKEGSDELLYDLHFWIGKYSTQDEYGAAAYKTVELDIFLNDKPVQHREVQQHESSLFRSYFNEITILKGGAETGFRHVEPEKYVPRLFQFRREKHNHVVVKEIPCFQESLDSDDVFIFDAGLELYQWNGKKSNKDERFRALQYVQNLKSERNGRPKVETLATSYPVSYLDNGYEVDITVPVQQEDRISPKNAFNTKLPTGGKKREKKAKDTTDGPSEKKLYKVSDAGDKLQMTHVTTGDISRDYFKSEDAFVLDQGNHVFVWIGSRASDDEKKNALPMAHKYLMQSDHPFAPTTVLIEGNGESKEFDSVFE